MTKDLTNSFVPQVTDVAQEGAAFAGFASAHVVASRAGLQIRVQVRV